MKKIVLQLLSVFILAGCGTLQLLCPDSSQAGGNTLLNVRFDNGNILAGIADDRNLEILVSAPDIDDRFRPDISPQMNIALVIDQSGSMREVRKMDYVKQAARSIVERLRSCDRIALITYSDEAQVLIPMQEARNKGYFMELIDSIYPNGTTNLGAGLQAGYREVRKWYRGHSVNRVILLSDGLANKGITSTRQLGRITSGYYEEGISLSTLGVGTEFDEDLMASLAMDGGGMYYYIDRPARIPEILAEEFSSLQSLVASNIILRVEFVPHIGIRKVIGNRYEHSGKTVIYNVGELSAGERRRYMIRLHIPELAAGTHTLGYVRLEYTDPESKKDIHYNKQLLLESMPDIGRVDKGWNTEVIERSYIFKLNEARKKASLAVDQGKTDEALQVLSDAEKMVEAAPVKSKRLEQKRNQVESYAASLKRRPRGVELESMQKREKHRSFVLEGE